MRRSPGAITHRRKTIRAHLPSIRLPLANTELAFHPVSSTWNACKIPSADAIHPRPFLRSRVRAASIQDRFCGLGFESGPSAHSGFGCHPSGSENSPCMDARRTRDCWMDVRRTRVQTSSIQACLCDPRFELCPFKAVSSIQGADSIRLRAKTTPGWMRDEPEILGWEEHKPEIPRWTVCGPGYTRAGRGPRANLSPGGPAAPQPPLRIPPRTARGHLSPASHIVGVNNLSAHNS